MAEILDISCDEAGHTGPDLLHKQQRIFTFGSVAISDAEAFEIIQKARASHPIKMVELKASRLLSSERGRHIVAKVLTALEGRYVVSAYDKLFALCAWLFEFIYEPVYQQNPKLLYEKNLHRFVAMYTYLWMTDPTSNAKVAIQQFQKYMRSRDPVDAPLLFDNPKPPLSDNGTEHPFECVLRFAYGYRDIIIADNAQINMMPTDQGRWALDLSASALWSHLNYWGRTGKLLSVHCDSSKPLEAIVSKLTGDETDPAIKRARANFKPEPLGWKLVSPVAFVDSRDHPAIQLADIVAGTAFMVFTNGLPGCETIVESIGRHGHGHSILPDMDAINPENRSAAVNALIVYDLAKRAERHSDPFENLELMYHMAEVSWARGDYEVIRKTVTPRKYSDKDDQSPSQ